MLSLSSKGKQALVRGNVSETELIVLETLSDLTVKGTDELVSDKIYRDEVIKTLNPDVVDATTDQLIKQGFIIGYIEEGTRGIGVT